MGTMPLTETRLPLRTTHFLAIPFFVLAAFFYALGSSWGVATVIVGLVIEMIGCLVFTLRPDPEDDDRGPRRG
jgi:hypothetical protein